MAGPLQVIAVGFGHGADFEGRPRRHSKAKASPHWTPCAGHEPEPDAATPGSIRSPRLTWRSSERPWPGSMPLPALRNADITRRLYRRPALDRDEAHRRCERVSRLIVKLRGHGLVAKVPRSRQYRVTPRRQRAGTRRRSEPYFPRDDPLPDIWPDLRSHPALYGHLVATREPPDSFRIPRSR
jgi:hypothetical protein